MSFKANKANFKIISRPIAKLEPRQSKIASLAATALQLANTKNIQKAKRADVVEVETSELVENLDSSAIFEKIFKRGINPYRGEIVFVNEFQPLAVKNSKNTDEKSINLNFGNNKILEVTNVARLIELQHTLRKNAIRQANYLIRRYGNARVNERQLISTMQNQIENEKKFRKMYSPNLANFKKNLIKETKNNIRNFRLSNQVRNLDNDYLNLVAEYVLNKYVAKQIVLYIARLFDYKEKIEKGIELNSKSLVLSKKHSGVKINRNKISNTKSLIGKGRANFQRNTKNSLSQAILNSSKSNLDRSNFENLLDLISHMTSLIYCHDTIDDLKEKSHESRSNITYGRTGNLKEAFRKLNKITLTGCFDRRNIPGLTSASSERRLNKANLSAIYSSVGADNNPIATAEMVAAICFNQTCWANFRSKQENSSITERFESLTQYLTEFFIEIPRRFSVQPERVFEDKSFLEYKDSEKLGKFFKRLFNERTYKDKTYVPFETNNTIASNIYEKTLSFPGEEIYFTSAIKNNDKIFSELKKFTEDIKKLTDELSGELLKNISLDFDEEGVPLDKNNTLVDKLNPLSYFNFHLSNLAKDIEICLQPSDQLSHNVVGLAACMNSAEDFGEIANTYIGSLMGILCKNPEFWANDNWIRNQGPVGFQAGSNVYASVLSECKYRTELAIKSLLEGTGMLYTGYRGGHEGFAQTAQRYRSVLADDPNQPFAIGPGMKFNIGVSNDFHFNPKLKDVDEADFNFDAVLFPAIADDSPEKYMRTIKFGQFRNASDGSIGTARRRLRQRVGLDEDTATRFVPGGIYSAPKFYKTITNTNSQNLYDRILNGTGRKAVGTQFAHRGTYMAGAIFHSGLNKHEKSSFVQVPEITSNNANRIDTIKNMYFFVRDPSQNSDGARFRQNERPGNSGEMFKTSAIHRGLIFYIYALGLLTSTQRMAVSCDHIGELRFHIKRSRIRGLLKALKGENLGRNASESEKHAYEEATERIDMVRSRIIARQDYILRCIAHINDKVDSLVSTYKNLIAFSDGSSAGPSFPLVKSKLDENNFFNDTFSLLNPSYRDYLANAYSRNFVTSTSFMYSYFPQADNYHINDLKIMYKVLSGPGYGFLENEKLGRKNIYHVGVPLGLLEYLRREAYKETGDEDYLDSSLIVITVYKNNQISSETKYVPKQFVFDMSKHVFPFYYDRKGKIRYCRHVKRMTDDINFNKVIENIEIMVFNEGSNFGFKRNGYGKKGIVGNKTSDTSGNYDDDNNFIEAVTLNQVFDYYLKLYTSLTTSIEINESMFLVDQGKAFTGEVDNSASSNFKNKIIQKVLLSQPRISETDASRERFIRAANSLNNSILLSSNNRLKEMLSVGCFERVFSLLINERDFLIDDEDINSMFLRSPKVNMTSKIQRTQFNPFYASRVKSNTIKNYLNELNDKHTSMSGFTIDIGLLKKW